MWLFTVYGFYSVSFQSGKSVVRARSKEHLQNLQKKFGMLSALEIQESDSTDYRWRLIVPKLIWSKTVSILVEEQDWSNFKNEVCRLNGYDEYAHALHKVWDVMYKLQEQEEKERKKEGFNGSRRVPGRSRIGK